MMQSTPAEHKIILGGNHDAVLDSMTPAQVSKHLFTENVSLSTSTAGKTRVNEKGLVEGKLHPRKERVNEKEKNTAAKKRQEQEQGREREQADKYRVDGWVYPSKSTDKDILTEASTSTETETETEKSESKSKSKTYYLDNAFVSIRGLQIFGTPCSSGLSRNVAFQTQIHREKAWRAVMGLREGEKEMEGLGIGIERGGALVGKYLLLSHALDLECKDFASETACKEMAKNAKNKGKNKNIVSSSVSTSHTQERQHQQRQQQQGHERFPRPLAHIWGHHHSTYGSNWLSCESCEGEKEKGKGMAAVEVAAEVAVDSSDSSDSSVLCVCATTMDSSYNPCQLPIVIDLPLPVY